jgi:addiction module HigA family antidote
VADLLRLEVGWSAQRRDRGLPLGVCNMPKLLEEIHPGEIMLEEFMKPMGISARQLAADIDVSPSRISELVNGQRPITADTALRLGLFFGMEPRFWLNLQSEYDIRVADRELRAKLSPRIRVFHVTAA